MSKRKHDIKMALKNGAEEILRQRQVIDILQIKAGAFESFQKLIDLLRQHRHDYAGGHATDAAWLMRNLLHEIEEEEKREAEENGKANTRGEGKEGN